MAVKKGNLVAFRLSDEEFEFLQNSVDYFYFDSVSAVIRSYIRQAMHDDDLGVSRRVPLETR